MLRYELIHENAYLIADVWSRATGGEEPSSIDEKRAVQAVRETWPQVARLLDENAKACAEVLTEPADESLDSLWFELVDPLR